MASRDARHDDSESDEDNFNPAPADLSDDEEAPRNARRKSSGPRARDDDEEEARPANGAARGSSRAIDEDDDEGEEDDAGGRQNRYDDEEEDEGDEDDEDEDDVQGVRISLESRTIFPTPMPGAGSTAAPNPAGLLQVADIANNRAIGASAISATGGPSSSISRPR